MLTTMVKNIAEDCWTFFSRWQFILTKNIPLSLCHHNTMLKLPTRGQGLMTISLIKVYLLQKISRLILRYTRLEHSDWLANFDSPITVLQTRIIYAGNSDLGLELKPFSQ